MTVPFLKEPLVLADESCVESRAPQPGRRWAAREGRAGAEVGWGERQQGPQCGRARSRFDRCRVQKPGLQKCGASRPMCCRRFPGHQRCPFRGLLWFWLGRAPSFERTVSSHCAASVALWTDAKRAAGVWTSCEHSFYVCRVCSFRDRSVWEQTDLILLGG